jgi:predicted metalloprotease with PDZ domain
MERDITLAADSSRVRPGYLSLLGYSVFAYVEGLEERPVRLEVEVPRDWPCLTTLAPQSPMPKGSTGGNAPSFYALADSQVAAGPDLVLRQLEFDVPLFLAVYAEGGVDVDVMGRLVLEAMAATVEYFGEAPFNHFTVLMELLEPVSERHTYNFSMEHLDSATFYLGADRGVTAGSSEIILSRTKYNLAHHFAHAWIPKRSYGEGYYPFTWELAPILDTIWFSEGFGQYAAIEAIADRLPEDDGKRFRERMLETRFRRSLAEAPPFIRRMSLVELSRIASTQYSEDFRTGRNVFSRGGLMAAEMDELIRERSGGTRRLRDALRHLVQWSEREKRAFSIDELPAIFEEATGVDTSEVLERWLTPIER